MWHRTTRDLVASGSLNVVAIATEQHRERTALWADWQAIDWPILWDPFNLTGSFAVPNAIFVDAEGTVVSTNVRPDALPALVEAAVSAGDLEPDSDSKTARASHVAQLDRIPADAPDRAHLEALSRCLFSGEAPSDADLATLRAASSGDERRADHVFWHGVAERLAYDAGADQLGFRRAVAAWQDAHALTPNQYIWRRRIQQYGPRMDQPYDFYAWIPQALAALEADAPRGPLGQLTPTELALGAGDATPGDSGVTSDWIEPDPERTVIIEATAAQTRDLFASAVAVAGTGRARERTCVHLHPIGLSHAGHGSGHGSGIGSGLGSGDAPQLFATAIEYELDGSPYRHLATGSLYGGRHSFDLPTSLLEGTAPIVLRYTQAWDATGTASTATQWSVYAIDLRVLLDG